MFFVQFLVERFRYLILLQSMVEYVTRYYRLYKVLQVTTETGGHG
jgi:hypothetical protein